ncbi:kinase-like protein [Pseudovirgaria hyperparasitica]|uniref:Kinase-like protein n=1 Tax=Pseudovirgaria hyperparasitica TaxID=470096 RepID=A0A6A6WI42_9PEZI|nr:kinase-like protein [Pseudovirgaria hyperparasitica]KAF2761775.1 kinase-like protein [Pseudovirgaria hyperparasitica]
MTSKAAVLQAYDHTSLDGVSGEADITPQGGPIVNIIEGKGDFLAGGATGLVERLGSGDVVKSPWTGRPTASDCRKEMAVEAQIYERLGAHPRLVRMKHWDPISHALTLEYMPNGNLKAYVQKHGQEISPLQRQQWVKEVVEGVELLHSHNVIQGDVGPHNCLLDIDLSLRICDFGGSSLDGSQATVAPGVRYRLPNLGEVTVKEDLFALGSTIYFIVTGHEPYEELTDDQVGELYKDGVFPGLDDVAFAEIIILCWRQEAESAKMTIDVMKRLLENRIKRNKANS